MNALSGDRGRSEAPPAFTSIESTLLLSASRVGGRMRVLKLGVAAGVGAVLSVSLLAQGPRRDGNWEVTMTMEMAGMPQGMSMPPVKTTQCITPEQAKDPSMAMPQRPAGRGGAANPDDCKVTDYKQDGNKV